MSEEVIKKHPGGRPLLYESVEELQKKIQEYFDYCMPHPEEVTYYEYHKVKKTKMVKNRKGEEVEKEYEDIDRTREPYPVKEWVITQPKIPTVTGLALHLKTSRETLINYQDREEFFDTIKESKDIIENKWEEMLQGSQVTGVIFNLKNNYGWKDKTETDVTTGGEKLNVALVEFVDGNNQDQSTDS